MAILEELTARLSSTDECSLVLLICLKYMANDCDYQSIVIEDSVRSQFFKLLDAFAEIMIFSGILEPMSAKLEAMDKMSLTPNNPASVIEKLKREVIWCFKAWIRLRLPDSAMANLHLTSPTLLHFVFKNLTGDESKNSVVSDELQEAAQECVIELVRTASGSKNLE